MRAVAITASASFLALVAGAVLAFYGCHVQSTYHWTMLRYHGKETKDGNAQEYHARSLVEAGPAGIPLVVAEIEGGDFNGRCDPGMIELLQRFGEPAKKYLKDRLIALSPASPSRDDIQRRHRIREALTLAFADVSELDEWVKDVERLGEDKWESIDDHNSLLLLSWLAQKSGMSDRPFVLPTGKLSPNFKEWIEQVKLKLQKDAHVPAGQ